MEVGFSQPTPAYNISTKVTCHVQWKDPKNTTVPFTHDAAVIEKWTPSSLQIDEVDNQNVITIDADENLDAVVEYLVPVVKKDDKYELSLKPVPALRQQIILQLPEDNYEINSTGVVQQKVNVVKKSTTVALTPMFKQPVKIDWRQKISSRNAKKADFMSELHTMVYLTEGVIYYDNQLNLQVVSGLLGQAEISLPVNQYPVSVKGTDVANWFYDQTNSLLKVGFKKKLNGHSKLSITTQQTTKSFPGTLEIQPLSLEQASQKRGRVNISADASVDFKVLEHKNGLKLESQPNFKIYSVANHLTSQARMNVKSFRFSNQQVALKVAVKPMKADIRVVENSTFSIEEERILYSSLFNVTVLKAGVYSLRIDIPTGFDVDRVDCNGVSHWDEFSENGKNYLMLFFKERLLGRSQVATVISRINQQDANYTVESVQVAESTKHTGVLKVISDSGTRLELVNKEGVAEVNLSKNRKSSSNELNFRVLRGDRNVNVKVDRLKPWVELDKLSKISLRDKNCRVEEQLSFKVENAGIKSFTVVAPKGVGQLEFDGKNIVKIDHDKNEWKVTFDQRVFGYYNLKVRYQFGYDGALAEFSPLVVKNTGLLRAYVALIVKSTRLQVQSKDLTKSLKIVESMLLPARWQREVAESVNCWQNIDDSYQLQLQVQQYDSATGLPAEVTAVHIDTVVTEDGEQVSRANIQIKSGSKRYLVVNLPTNQKLWRASVDGAFVTPLNENNAVMIPLQQQIFNGDVVQKSVNIELVYAGESTKGWALENQVYEGPKFDLPLRNVTWSLYVPDGKYSKFDGTMQWLPQRSGIKRRWTMNALEEEVSQQMGSEEQKVKSLYRKGVNLANKGDNFAARQMYEQALNFGMSRELNEDLNVQLQDLQRSQAVVGLVKRRNEAFSNIAPAVGEQRVQIEDNDWNRGSFNRELMTKVQKTLGRSETDIFNKISDKIISQQRSVNRRLRLINPSIPWNGKQLVFERKLQVSPNEEMKLTCSREVSYKVTQSSWSSIAIVALIFIAIGGIVQYSKK